MGLGSDVPSALLPFLSVRDPVLCGLGASSSPPNLNLSQHHIPLWLLVLNTCTSCSLICFQDLRSINGCRRQCAISSCVLLGGPLVRRTSTPAATTADAVDEEDIKGQAGGGGCRRRRGGGGQHVPHRRRRGRRARRHGVPHPLLAQGHVSKLILLCNLHQSIWF